METAGRVEYYSIDDYTLVDSKRDYITHKIDTTVEDHYDRDDRKLRTFYEDDETGIITSDVAKFEAWMDKVTGTNS